jgi:hypothetical protein
MEQDRVALVSVPVGGDDWVAEEHAGDGATQGFVGGIR